VPTPDDAIQAATWLKHNNAGRATFLVTGLHGGSDEVDVDLDVDVFSYARESVSPRSVKSVCRWGSMDRVSATSSERHANCC
jgi:hypothetical protein